MFHSTLLAMPDTFSSFCSTPPQPTPNSLLLTRIRRTSCTTPPAGMLFGHLAESSPHTSHEPKSCIGESSEHTPIDYSSRKETASTSRMTLPPQSQLPNTPTVFHQQAAASGSPQPAPTSVVDPWCSADMWSSTRKLVRSNASIASVEGTLSRGKKDR